MDAAVVSHDQGQGTLRLVQTAELTNAKRRQLLFAVAAYFDGEADAMFNIPAGIATMSDALRRTPIGGNIFNDVSLCLASNGVTLGWKVGDFLDLFNWNQVELTLFGASDTGRVSGRDASQRFATVARTIPER